MVISLLDTYKITHNEDFLDKATNLLDTLSLPNNALGLWDTSREGYFYAVAFQGSSPADPGSMQVDSKRKEAGRQAIMLQAFRLAWERLWRRCFRYSPGSQGLLSIYQTARDRTKKKRKTFSEKILRFLGSGNRTRTCDLRVMSPTS